MKLQTARLMLLSILPLAILLHGCAAPIFVAGAASGAVVASDERSTAVMLDDQVVEARIKDKIYKHPDLVNKVHINVTSYNGVVLLTGETLSSTMVNTALTIARNEEIVRRVHNEVRVADLSNLQARSNDALITTRVKAQMLTAKEFPSAKVKVVTENGVVYLLGIVSTTIGNQAAEIARHVSGVARVVKLFEYN